MKERATTIGSLTVYYRVTARGMEVTYCEQAGRPYVLTDEELAEVLETLEAACLTK